MSKLEVEISGDVKKLKSAINDATGQLKGLAKQGVDAGKKVNRNASSAARGIKGLSNETVNAVPALNEFSRVIQDAPYGIQGVANNITQLTTQFGYLTKKTGSAKGALKAMLGSLTGPAGILLAISAVTTLLVSFGNKLFSSSKNADKLKSSSKGVNDELKSQSAILKELIKNFDQFDKIRIISRFNTIKEREELKALNLNVLDYTQSEKTRIRALTQLIKLYPRYFKGLDISQTNDLIKAEDAVNKVLLRKQKLKQTLIKLEEATQKLENNSIELSEKRGSSNIKDFERVKILDSQNLRLRDQIKILREALELFVSYDTSFKELQNQKPIVVPVTIGQPAGLTRVDTGGVGDQLVGLELGNTIAGQIAADIEAINTQRLKEKMQEIQFSANMLSQSIQQSFANITNSISQNLQNSLGFLGSFLGELLNFFSQVIQAKIRQQVQEMALAKKQQIINAVTAKSQLASDKVRAASSAAVAASNTAKAAGPKGAFLLPILIAGALGAVSSAFSKIGSSGGSMGTGSVSGAGSSRGFSSGTTFGGARPFSGNLTFTIRGMDLVAVLNSANSQNGIIGGNVSVG